MNVEKITKIVKSENLNHLEKSPIKSSTKSFNCVTPIKHTISSINKSKIKYGENDITKLEMIEKGKFIYKKLLKN